MVDALRQADHAEHAGEVLKLDKPFRDQKIGLEERAGFNDEADSVFHHFQHDLHIVRQHVVQEILRILRFQRAFVQPDPRQREAASANFQAIVTGSNRIVLAPLAGEHRVVGKRGLGGL